jgi:hypothetical protein
LKRFQFLCQVVKCRIILLMNRFIHYLSGRSESLGRKDGHYMIGFKLANFFLQELDAGLLLLNLLSPLFLLSLQLPY